REICLCENPCPLYPPKADIAERDRDVRFVPETDSCSAANCHHSIISSVVASSAWDQLLCFRRRVGEDGRHTVRIDVESQEGQRVTAGISPLMHEAGRLIDQG